MYADSVTIHADPLNSVLMHVDPLNSVLMHADPLNSVLMLADLYILFLCMLTFTFCSYAC
jgi:energy-converting hydrogenase Eha subunit C